MNKSTKKITQKLQTISHDKIFKIIASRGIKSRNDNFLISRSSFNFLTFNFSNSQKSKLKNNPFLNSFFEKYNSKSYFFGIKATKKHFKKANARNKIKRRIKSIIQDYIKTHPIVAESTRNNSTNAATTKHVSHYNFIVIIPLPNMLTQKFSDSRASLFELLNKQLPHKPRYNNTQ